jgi:hypothetical protein
MVINSTNINKTNNHLSSLPTKHRKDHDIWRWKSRSWLGTGSNMYQVKPEDVMPFNYIHMDVEAKQIKFPQGRQPVYNMLSKC